MQTTVRPLRLDDDSDAHDYGQASERTDNPRRLERRGLVASAAALVAAVVAERAATPVTPATGDNLVIGNTGAVSPFSWYRVRFAACPGTDASLVVSVAGG